MFTATQLSKLAEIVRDEEAEVKNRYGIGLIKVSHFPDYVKQSLKDMPYDLSEFIYISRNDKIEINMVKQAKSHISNALARALVSILTRAGKEKMPLGLKSQEWLKTQLISQSMQEAAQAALKK